RMRALLRHSGIVDHQHRIATTVGGAATTRVTRRPYGRYDKPLLSREPNSVLLCPGPRQQFIESLRGPAIDELGEDVGEISLGIDAVKFCGLDQRRETCPVDRALVVAGE